MNYVGIYMDSTCAEMNTTGSYCILHVPNMNSTCVGVNSTGVL
jgi:hypothetical protein